MNEKDYHIIVRCRHCPIPIVSYDFTLDELLDYIEKGKDRPVHWGWVEHKGYMYQGREK